MESKVSYPILPRVFELKEYSRSKEIQANILRKLIKDAIVMLNAKSKSGEVANRLAKINVDIMEYEELAFSYNELMKFNDLLDRFIASLE